MRKLEVGDFISVQIKNGDWFYLKTTSQYLVDSILNHTSWYCDWQYGLHESLLPDTWRIAPITPSHGMLEFALDSMDIPCTDEEVGKLCHLYENMLRKVFKYDGEGIKIYSHSSYYVPDSSPISKGEESDDEITEE